MLGKLLMLCGQQVEPMLVVCMMRQGPGGWVCPARNLSSQLQKHTPDKNWPNPSGCQSLTGQAWVFTSHETVRIRGPCTVSPPNILELPRMDWVDSRTTLIVLLTNPRCSLSWKTTKGEEMWAGTQIINQIITDPPQQYSPDSYSHTPSL